MLLYHNVHLDVDPGENVCPAERALFQVQAAVVAATEMSTWQQDDAALQTRGFYHSKLLNLYVCCGKTVKPRKNIAPKEH